MAWHSISGLLIFWIFHIWYLSFLGRARTYMGWYSGWGGREEEEKMRGAAMEGDGIRWRGLCM